MATVTISEARATLPALVDRVEQGEEVTILRHGKPVALVVRPSTRSASPPRGDLCASDLHGLLERGRLLPLDQTIGLTEDEADDLIGYVDAGRGRR